MISKQITILNKIGLHARPCSLLVNTGKKYESKVNIKNDNMNTPLNSVIGIMRLQAKKGDSITISADGPDENEVLAALIELIESKFGED